jgi:hypothetical protein
MIARDSQVDASLPLTSAAVCALTHYRRRTLLRAVAARHLATVARWKEGDESFRAALVADLGIVILLTEADALGDADLLDAERTREFDHAPITRRLLAERGVSRSLLTTIAEARDAGDPSRRPGHAAQLLYVAELLVSVLSDDRADLWPALADAAERHLRLPADALAELGTAIELDAAVIAGSSAAAPSAENVIAELLERARDPVVEKSETATAETAGETHTPTPSATDDLRTLHGLVRSAATDCRRDEAPLSLLLVEVAAASNDTAAAASTLAAACASLEWAGAQITEVGPLRTALVLPRCERRRALAFSDELRRRFRTASRKPRSIAKLGVGIATVDPPTRHFDVVRFTAAAERCLVAARSAAGDATKSIEWF